jgi:hypothetical protein
VKNITFLRGKGVYFRGMFNPDWGGSMGLVGIKLPPAEPFDEIKKELKTLFPEKDFENPESIKTLLNSETDLETLTADRLGVLAILILDQIQNYQINDIGTLTSHVLTRVWKLLKETASDENLDIKLLSIIYCDADDSEIRKTLTPIFADKDFIALRETLASLKYALNEKEGGDPLLLAITTSDPDANEFQKIKKLLQQDLDKNLLELQPIISRLRTDPSGLLDLLDLLDSLYLPDDAELEPTPTPPHEPEGR